MKRIILRLTTAMLVLIGLAESANYTATGHFIEGSEVGTDSSFTPTYSPDSMRISWGGGDNQSYLQLVAKSGTAEGNGTEYPFGDLIHGNFPISPPSLVSVDLNWTLSVTGTPSGETFERTWTFTLYNWETTNSLDPCPRETDGVVVSPAGYPFLGDGTSESNCDDAHNFGAAGSGTFEQDYTWVDNNNDIWYFQFSGFYDQFGVLTSTFWSPEGGESTGSVNFSVTSKGQNDTYIGDRVWLDANNDGIQDSTETTGPTGFIVQLWEVNGSVETKIDETLTDANGRYSFVNVKKTDSGDGTGAARVYNIKFVPSSNLVGLFEFTDQYAVGASDPTEHENDSDANASGVTENFSISVDSNGTENIDAGIKRGAIGNQVWIDANQDGIQDTAEVGLDNVVVNLYADDNVTLLQTTSTDELGMYLFAPLPAGDFFVEFILPTGYALSPKNEGGDSEKDSDADLISGRTDMISIGLEDGDISAQPDWDAGMFQELNITKETNATEVIIGDQIMYMITVTNTSERNASDVNVTDNLPTGITYDTYSASQGTFDGTDWIVGALDANGGSAELNITVTVDENGTIENNATVISEQNSIEIWDDVNFTAYDPGITVEKTTNGTDEDSTPGPIVQTGVDRMYWEYTVTNTGDVNLNNITLNDDEEGTITCPETILLPGESMTCEYNDTIDTAGQYENNATVSGEVLGRSVTHSDVNYAYAEDPSLSIVKHTNGELVISETGPELPLDSDVTWTYIIRNTGDVNITIYSIEDDQEGTPTCPEETLPFVLTPDQVITCELDGTVEFEGQYENNVTVLGHTIIPNTDEVTEVNATASSRYYGGNCPCEDVDSDSSSSMNTTAGILMIFMTVVIGLFFVRREEKLNRNQR